MNIRTGSSGGVVLEGHTWIPWGKTTMIPALNSPPRRISSLLSLISGDLSSALRFLETFLPLSFVRDLRGFDEENVVEDTLG
jgi:hypothetical protein